MAKIKTIGPYKDEDEAARAQRKLAREQGVFTGYRKCADGSYMLLHDPETFTMRRDRAGGDADD